MSQHRTLIPLLLLLAACGKTADAGGAGGSAPAVAQDTTSQIKAALNAQMALIAKGDVEGLRATFTERQRERITAEAVSGVKDKMAKTTIDELVSKVEESGDNAKVTMPNGRTLTTFIRTGGKWLADTIWFK